MSEELEPPYAFIRDAFAKRRIIPFLGAGASRGLRPPDTAWAEAATFLPNGGELANHLALMSEFPKDDHQRDLAKVAQYFDAVIGRASLNEKLHEIFAANTGRTRSMPFSRGSRLLCSSSRRITTT